MHSFAIVTLLLAACAVNAANIVVNVGSTAGLLAFSNNSIAAAINDTITFNFLGGNHSVTQSSFNDPCTRTPGGFGSGFHSAGDQFVITINASDTKPIWYYCGQTSPVSHCQHGMVGAINAPLTGNTTFQAFQALANSTSSATSTGTPSAYSSAVPEAPPASATSGDSPSGTSGSDSPTATPAAAAAMQIGGSTLGALTAMAFLVGLAL